MNNHFTFSYRIGSTFLVSLLVVWASVAQAAITNTGARAVENRITSLERLSNAQGQLLNQLRQQLADNQRDLEMLRGQIQESRYQLGQVVVRQKNLYQQLHNLEQQAKNTVNLPKNSSSEAITVNETKEATSQGDENSDYNTAVSLALEKKEYDRAISEFQTFIKRYPESTYQPNANYWLGQLFYNKKGKKDDASYYYATVVKNYPTSSKAPDAMYKVGVILQEKNQLSKAKAVYQQVIKAYPDSDAAKLAKKREADL